VKASIRFGRTEISAGFFLVLAVLIFLDTQRLITLIMLAALLHELAHLTVIRVTGGRVAKIELTAVGAEISIDSFAGVPLFQQLMVYLSGPAANLLFAFISSKFGGIFPSQELYAFAGANLVIGMFNLLPAKMLDGGNALRVLCIAMFGRKTAIPEVLHAITLAFLLTLCILLAINYGFSLSLFIAIVWMVIGYFRERHARLKWF